jgi:hypothetical protein
VEKYFRAAQVTDDSTAHAHFMLDTYGYKHTLMMFNTFSFPLQQWFQECAAAVRYTYIA